jgi:MobA/VirD2-like, nuclease domain
MITKPLPRHHDLAALIFYLFKEGRQPDVEEKGKECLHVDPHLVAAWDDSLLGGELLSGKPARPNEVGQRELVDFMDSLRLMFGVNLKAGHVYHVPIAAHPDDGELGDERWRELAEEAVAAIGVQDCRWVAVWHGPNAAGADHIHLAVQLVGDDGKTARLSFDERKLRVWANEVEERLDLVRTARPGAGARGLTRAEYERAKATSTEPERRQLARLVRTAAAGAEGEVEFVATLRERYVDVRPRVEHGLVVGYSVALPPTDENVPVLHLAGGQLAHDLTLPRLREHWPPLDQVAEAAMPAHWQVPDKLPPLRNRVRWLLVQGELRAARKEAALLDPDDRPQWHAAVGETAELVCVLAVRLERDGPGPLHQAGDVLLDAARLGRPASRRPRPVVLPALAQAARIASHTADPAPVLVIAVLAIVALLLYDLATRQRYDQRPGQSGIALYRAADLLAEHRPVLLVPAENVVEGSAEQAVETEMTDEPVVGTPAAASTKRSSSPPTTQRAAQRTAVSQPHSSSRRTAR